MTMKRSFLLLLMLALAPFAPGASAQEIPAGHERVLLPIFTRPVSGAYGSDFRSELKLMNAGSQSLGAYGLEWICVVLCPFDPLLPFELEPDFVEDANPYTRSGNPGWFLFVPSDRIDDLVLQLRVYDVSREATNFGTEIPVVRDEEVTRAPLVLLGVPTDERFRNTLRIYSFEEGAFTITIEGANGVRYDHGVYAAPGESIFDPAYAAFVDFPANIGPVKVTIRALAPIVTPPALPPRFWAFNAVTNNETQHITVVSPQR
jgi:hypothetical protein